MIPRHVRVALAGSALLAACAITPPPAPSSHSAAPDPAMVATTPATPRMATVVGRGPERLEPRPMARPAQPSIAVRYRAELVPDPCADRDLPAPPTGDIVLTVLDRSYGLPASYAPDDLVPASEAGLTGISGTKLVRSVLIDDLAAMRAAWEAAGMVVIVDSAYRSHADQAATFDSWVARIGYDQAIVRSARPGHSEHQLGTAIDVSSPGWSGRFGDWAREAPEGAWMAEHAWEYGFVMSYPPGVQERTCFGYEPWHYRWIGRETAAEHRESDQVLREFLADHAGE